MHTLYAHPPPVQVYKALYDGVQVVAAKVLTGLGDERVFQSFVREVREGAVRDRGRERSVGRRVGRWRWLVGAGGG